jgi:4-hydroxy-tetrahydrodipicolinate synthase
MRNRKLSVVVIAIIPFDEANRVDEGMYRKQLRRIRDAGCSVYVAGSASGEAHTLSPEELDQVLAISAEELKGKVPFRAMGFEPRTAQQMIRFMRHVERAQIDTAQIFSLDMGHGAKPSIAEMEQYYSSVMESTSLKIYLSCHPRSMGFHLPLEMLERLCNRFPQIEGIAYGGLDMSYLAELIHRLGDRLEIHNAGPAIAVNTLSMGGNGFMGTEGNFSPELVQAVITSWQSEDFRALRESYSKLMRFASIHSRSGGGFIRSLKPLMNAFGLPGGRLRSPRLPISYDDLEQRVADIVKLDLPGIPAPLSPIPYP